MADNVRKYVEQARKNGRTVKSKHVNGYDYVYVFELDGWISIINVTGGYYRPVIQAKDEAHADSYISLIEPIPVPVNFI